MKRELDTSVIPTAPGKPAKFFDIPRFISVYHFCNMCGCAPQGNWREAEEDDERTKLQKQAFQISNFGRVLDKQPRREGLQGTETNANEWYASLNEEQREICRRLANEFYEFVMKAESEDWANESNLPVLKNNVWRPRGWEPKGGW